MLVETPEIQVGPVNGLARQLDDDHVQKLIEGYTSGSTVYELADWFKISRKGLLQGQVTAAYAAGVAARA